MRRSWVIGIFLTCLVCLTGGCHYNQEPLDDHVGDDLFVGDQINAPNGGNFGGVIFDGDGNIILPPDGEITAGHIDADSAVIGGVVIEDGDVDAPGTVTGGGIVDLPDEPDDDDETPTLVASMIKPSNNSVFRPGQSFEVQVFASGVEGQLRVKCLFPDATFFPDPNQSDEETEEMVDGSISFTVALDMLGTGGIFCQVTSEDGQEVMVTAWVTMKEPE